MVGVKNNIGNDLEVKTEESTTSTWWWLEEGRSGTKSFTIKTDSSVATDSCP